MAMTDKEICEWVVKAFAPMLKITSNEAISGDEDAAEDVMKMLSAKTWVLRKFGLMEDDDGKLVPFVPWEPDPVLKKFLDGVNKLE